MNTDEKKAYNEPGMNVPNAHVSVCFICDTEYVMYTSVAIASIVENKEEHIPYDIYVIASHLKNEDIDQLKSLEQSSVSIYVIRIDNDDKYRQLEKKGFPVSTAALFKFDLPQIFPNLDRILYLDGDLIVQRGLNELFNTDLAGAYAGVVSDYRGRSLKGDFRERLKIKHEDYFNSGVMLFDLALMRRDDIPNKLLDYRTHGINYYMDQDAFNVVIGENVKYLSFYNNLQMTCWRSMTVEEISKHYHLPLVNDRYEYVHRANIVHYTAQKPWKYYDGKCSEIWMHYFFKSPFAHVNLKRESVLTACKNAEDKSRLYQERVIEPGEYHIATIPLISVVMPAYNAEDFIGRALGSLQKQTLVDFEVICVDDASTDNTVGVIRTYAKQDPRIRLIIQKENRGAGAARNAAIREARGEYITFLDADDWMPEQALERFYQEGKHVDADFVFAQTKLDKGKVLESSYRACYIPNKACFSGEEIAEYAFSVTHGGPSGKMVKRQFVLQHDLSFLEIARSEDFFFFCMILALSKRIVAIREALYIVVSQANMKSLEHTKDETPTIFWLGIVALKEELKKRGLYEKYKNTFLNSNVVRVKYNIRSLKTIKGMVEVHAFLKECIYHELELDQIDRERFYEKDALEELLRVADTPVEEMIVQMLNRMAIQRRNITVKAQDDWQNKANAEQIKMLEAEVARLRHSNSWRIGRTMTWIPRKIKGFIRVMRQEGILKALSKAKNSLQALPINARKLWIGK